VLSNFQKRLDSVSVAHEEDENDEDSRLREDSINMEFEDAKNEDYNRYQN